MNRLNGKKGLLSAAGQGIGRATALAFGAEGVQVIATLKAGDVMELGIVGLGVQKQKVIASE